MQRLSAGKSDDGDVSLGINSDAEAKRIPDSSPWKPDCGEWVPATIDGIEVDALVLCDNCAITEGWLW